MVVKPIENVPLLPVTDQVVFPGLQASVNVHKHTHQDLKAALEKSGSDHLGIVTERRAGDGSTGIHKVGTYVKIAGTSQTTAKVDGEEVTVVSLAIQGLVRFEVVTISDHSGEIRLSTIKCHDDPLSDDSDPDLVMSLDGIKKCVQKMVQDEQALGQEVRRPPVTYLKDFFAKGKNVFGWPPKAGMLADQVVAALQRQVSLQERQEVLETFDVKRRVNLVFELVNRVKLQHAQELKSREERRKEPSRQEAQIRQHIEKLQRELAQLQSSRMKDANNNAAQNGQNAQDEVASLNEALKEAQLTADAQKIAQKELQRLQRIQPYHPEYTVCRNYLETLASVPWAKATEDVLDLKIARRMLEEDHYGLDFVKTRILEFVAVRKLRQDMKGPILCLHGPPGVGKTSLGRSIARALGRKFHRIALGGLRDEAELRGHRRTYIGSMPGSIIQAVISLQVRNPVILLDEVDKLSHNAMFNPAGALLEVLDPEQNSTFKDHYLNTPFSLAQVLFICTCNDLHTIDRPLLDRMEIIELSGYTMEEKVHIAETYLLPKQRIEHALEGQPGKSKEGSHQATSGASKPEADASAASGSEQEQAKRADTAPPATQEGAKPQDAPVAAPKLHLTRGAIMDLIEKWTSESGVRSLERRVAQVCRWAALRIADGPTSSVAGYGAVASTGSPGAEAAEAALADCGPHAEGGEIRVEAQHLPHIIGAEVFVPDIASNLTVGVAMGLSVTSTGGQLLFVEANKVRGSGKLTVTGHLGDVMRESVTLALALFRSLIHSSSSSPTSYPTGVLSMLLARCPNGDPFESEDIHVHFPAGSIPKDGPSAGVASLLALASLVLQKPMRKDTAVTGEVTLRGLVLPVGGIRDKVLAAHRAGVRHVLLPAGNERHAKTELPATLTDSIELHFMKHIDEALEWSFGSMSSEDVRPPPKIPLHGQISVQSVSRL